jgi:hypothetical protein
MDSVFCCLGQGDILCSLLLLLLCLDVVQGVGSSVSLASVLPGSYLLLITADDGAGGEASGTAKVTVTTAAEPPAAAAETSSGSSLKPSSKVESGMSSSSSNSSSQLPAQLEAGVLPVRPAAAAAAGSAVKNSSMAPQTLPAVGLPVGAVLDLDAEALALVPAGSKLQRYVWELHQQDKNKPAAVVYGRRGRFHLDTADVYNLTLLANTTDGQQYRNTGRVRVLSPQPGSSSILDALKDLDIKGSCGPLSGKQYSKVVLSCPGLSFSGVEKQRLKYAWKVYPISGGDYKWKNGSKPEVLGLAPGLHRVELSIGVDGTPSKINTVYYTVILLSITANSKLQLHLPQRICSGQAVQLEAPPLALNGASEPSYEWIVTWIDSLDVLGFEEKMKGSGRTFGLAVQPGRYDVSLIAHLADGGRLQGQGNFTVLPCIKCKPGVVNVTLPNGTCTALKAQAAAVLASEAPDGVDLSWHSTAAKHVGVRTTHVIAKMRKSKVAYGCVATVNFHDAEPPTIRLLNPGGVCLMSANQKWHCWKSDSLVQLSDNCQAFAPLAYMITCGSGSSRNTCKVLPDGRACARAATVGQQLSFKVQARDGSGNLAQPLEVPVVVKPSAAGAGCSMALLPSPESASSAAGGGAAGSAPADSSGGSSKGSGSDLSPAT